MVAKNYRKFVKLNEQDLSKVIGEVIQEIMNGKNLDEGIISKVGNKWRIKGKGGKLWSAHYDTKQDAEDGLQAYFANKK